MANYTAADVKALREKTGAGMMDCKKALDDANGDMAKAEALVLERGVAKAEKKADRATAEGYVASYVHTTGKVAVLVELLCETDFVGRNDEFRALARDIALQVAAMNPADNSELLAQPSIKDGSVTIETLIKQLSGKIGEHITLGRFVRLSVGE